MTNIPARIQTLFDKYLSLHTFAEVSIWDELAKKEIESLTASINAADQIVQHKSQLQEQARQERQQKPALLRLFASDSAEKKLQMEMEALKAQNEHSRDLIEEIQSKIDITPNDPKEQDALLKELNLEKKELQIKKREINEQMREIRTDARQKSVNIPNTLRGALSGSQYRASVRRNIRYQAEAALSPHEDAKSEVELEIIRLEKDMLWVERFS
jgi:chromosome segregation ATPase